MPFQLEQDGAAAGEVGRRLEAERVLPGVGVGDRVRDRAGGAGTLDVGEALVCGAPLGGALEPAMLVEQTGVEVEDAVADEVEAEVARLDDTGVDRPDRDRLALRFERFSAAR